MTNADALQTLGLSGYTLGKCAWIQPQRILWASRRNAAITRFSDLDMGAETDAIHINRDLSILMFGQTFAININVLSLVLTYKPI